MSNIAFIPVRGGSKSIPMKNIKVLNGKPLVYWTAAAASGAGCIDKVIIATDSEETKKNSFGFLNFRKLRFMTETLRTLLIRLLQKVSCLNILKKRGSSRRIIFFLFRPHHRCLSLNTLTGCIMSF